MDWIRVIYWVSIGIVWIESVIVWGLLWRNARRLKELDGLVECHIKAIEAYRFAQEAYEEKLAELNKEVSDERNSQD